MKFIWRFIAFFLILMVIGACAQTGDPTPAVALLLFYLSYISVFKGASMTYREYDPVDFASDDFNLRQ